MIKKIKVTKFLRNFFNFFCTKKTYTISSYSKNLGQKIILAEIYSDHKKIDNLYFGPKKNLVEKMMAQNKLN